ncbi:uncharacterized protein PAN0_003c1694 [Moesziomyces antarcticus]|uniref:uncharacterized protein n=1 Tax=Pseudozyma antarctica TaxID=84753 RepID=UPI0007195DB6|nr:uncharacterized protein PAN0_003c1694 [Moesziomyces antarcticus]GAK63489.1 hypothetical protein PAN0_003c1694 [Moesziomyces antarcticus]
MEARRIVCKSAAFSTDILDALHRRALFCSQGERRSRCEASSLFANMTPYHPILSSMTLRRLDSVSLGQRGEQQQQQQLRSDMQSHARLAITSFSPHSNVAHLQHSYRHHTSNSLPSYSAAARLASSLLQPSSATSTPSGLAIPAHQPKPS